MKSSLTVVALFVLMPCVVSGVGGCQSLTPELKGLAQTHDENHNMVRVTNNQNLRQIPDDLAKIWLVDNPGRLSAYPVTDTSGLPR